MPGRPRSSGGTMISTISRRSSGRCRPGSHKVVAFESVYSMDGDIAPVAEICALARATRPSPISTRCMRSASMGRAAAALPSATGSCEIDLIEGTLAKAFGVMGGYIAGSAAASTRSGRMRRASSSRRRWPRCWPPARSPASAISRPAAPSGGAAAQCRLAQANAGGARAAGAGGRQPYRAGADRRCGSLQDLEQPAAAGIRHLCPADQLPDGAARDRADPADAGAAAWAAPRSPGWSPRSTGCGRGWSWRAPRDCVS